MGFDDDDFFAGGGAKGGFGNHDAFGYNEGMSQYEEQSRPATRPTRQRRASLGVTSGPIMSLSAPIVPSKPMRMKSSDNIAPAGASTPARSGGRRQPSTTASDVPSSRGGNSTNSNSLNGRLEAVPGKVSSSGNNRSGGGGSSSGDRSVTSNGSNSQRRAGTRRASIAAGPSTSRSAMPQRQQQQQYRSNNEEADYGYGYDDQPQYQNNYNQDSEDMGYGDQAEEEEEYQQPVPQEEPVRARRQRRCSIADVVNTASIQPSQPDYGYGSTEGYSGAADDTRAAMMQRIGAIGNASISNMAIPMTLSDEPKRTNRRGSIAMLGNIGRTKAAKEPEPAATTKKPAADRDRQRQRQGTLLDRVGAGSSNDGRGASRTGTTSYSDRIMSK